MHDINRKLHILISCCSESWGGLEMAALETAIQLKKSGMQVTIAGLGNTAFIKKAGNYEFNLISLLPGNIHLLKNIFTIKKFIKTSDPNIIHSHLSHDLWILTPALKLSGSDAKLFLTKHMASGIKKKDIFHRFLYNRVNKAAAVSQYIKKSLVDTTSIPEDKIIVLPVGIDADKFNIFYNKEEIKTVLQIPLNKLVIGFTGRITPGKGHEDFFKAAKILNKKFPGELIFLVVGSAGKEEEEYEKMIRQIPEDEDLKNVIFTGFTDEPQKYMSVFDILAFPSHDESFGRVLVEAMAMGIPTASSGFAGVLDITVENETGLLFEPKNPVSMAEALSKLISDRDLRHKFSVNGKKRFQEYFTLDKVTKSLLNLYYNT